MITSTDELSSINPSRKVVNLSLSLDSPALDNAPLPPLKLKLPNTRHVIPLVPNHPTIK